MNTKMKEALNKKHFTILDKLKAAGYEAYVVGGAVRDVALGKENKDVDITTSATPKEIMEVFKGFNTIDVGNEHGTVPVVVNHEQIEVTTFRTDGKYSDGRRPDTVTFTKSLKDDLVRRDFTINALAYSVEKGIIDLVGGLKDIENEEIKAVGNPNERFQEDPLRILRGLRFASKLGFTIEEKTSQAMFENKGLLEKVSKERIQKEFDGLLLGSNAKTILMDYKEILAVIIPGIQQMFDFDQKNPNHIYDVWEHSATVVKNAKDDIAHKIAAVYHDSGKPSKFVFDEEKQKGTFHGHAEVSAKIAGKALKELKYPNKLIAKVLDLIVDHDEQVSKKPYKIKKFIYEKGSERFFEMLEIKRADDSSKHPDKIFGLEDYAIVEEIAKEYLQGSPILSHKDLEITPEEIISIGFKGKEIKEALDGMALQVISGFPNSKEKQINYMVKKLKQMKG